MSVRPDDLYDMPPPRSERSMAGLFGDLARLITRLLHQEIALGRAELGAKLSELGTGAVEMVAGGLIIYAGFLALLVAAGLGLALVLQPWLAALAVGAVTVIIGAIIAFIGKRAVSSRTLVPERTLRSLRKDAAWAREQMR
jgi:Putative Actinobacterial Holin-X, holin superfamily III